MSKPRAGHDHRRWRLSYKKAHIDTVRNDINVTPLVDVMLVLLIIFMLMTLVMGRGHEVKLPRAHYYSQEHDKMQPVVTVDNAGMLYFAKSKLGPVGLPTLKEMGSRIEAAWKAPKDPEAGRRVYVKADQTVAYGKVLPVLMYLHNELSLDSVDLAIAKDSEDK
jgi:biopolymer transport protein ExbD